MGSNVSRFTCQVFHMNTSGFDTSLHLPQHCHELRTTKVTHFKHLQLHERGDDDSAIRLIFIKCLLRRTFQLKEISSCDHVRQYGVLFPCNSLLTSISTNVISWHGIGLCVYIYVFMCNMMNGDAMKKCVAQICRSKDSINACVCMGVIESAKENFYAATK